MNRHLVFKIIISIWTHGNMQITVSGSANLSICNTEVYSTNAFCLSVIYLILFVFFYLEAIPHHNLLLKNKTSTLDRERKAFRANKWHIDKRTNKQTSRPAPQSIKQVFRRTKISILAACI